MARTGNGKAHVEGVLSFGYPSVSRPWGKQSRHPDAPDLPCIGEAYAGAAKKACTPGRGPTEVTRHTAVWMESRLPLLLFRVGRPEQV